MFALATDDNLGPMLAMTRGTILMFGHPDATVRSYFDLYMYFEVTDLVYTTIKFSPSVKKYRGETTYI